MKSKNRQMDAPVSSCFQVKDYPRSQQIFTLQLLNFGLTSSSYNDKSVDLNCRKMIEK